MNSSKNNSTNPPLLASKFLEWFLKEELHEEVAGDLEEKFHKKTKASNLRKAQFDYWRQVFGYLRPFAVRRTLLTDINPFFLLNSHIKIAWRNIFIQKFNSSINLLGMTIGMTCFILIALYIQYELSYDLQHEKAEQIYRVSMIQEGNEFKGTDRFACAPSVLVPTMLDEIPEVENGTTITIEPALISLKDQTDYHDVLFADESLFEVFSYTIIEGLGQEALQNIDAIILTESMSKKFFGKTSPLGKVINLYGKRKLVVQGVIKDVPANQHFGFDFITSIQNYPNYKEDITEGKWGSNNYWAYVVLSKNHDLSLIEQKMKVLDHRAKEDYLKSHFQPSYFLQPLKDIHLHSNINMEMGKNSDIRYIYFSATIAFIILLLALINYMNLATARSSKRAKEVGLRKTLGANRKQLINQFMVESILMTILSLIIALSAANLLLPQFNQLLDLNIQYNLNNNQFLNFGCLLIIVFMGIGSGLYPAIMSSAVKPVNALKGSWFKNKDHSNLYRNTLVIGQFTAAIVLAIGSVIVYQQLQFIQNKKLGYSRDQIVYVPFNSTNIFSKINLLETEILKNPNIENFSVAANIPLNSDNQGNLSNWEGNTTGKKVGVFRNRVDYNFIDLFEMDIVEGRNFSPDFPTDSLDAYLVNESAVKAFGWETAIGKKLGRGTVIGVVKDFHFQPFNLSIEPMSMSFRSRRNLYSGYLLFKIKSADSNNTLAYMEKTMNSTLPQIPFNHFFMDESYDQLYKTEQRFGQAFNIFTIIALFIACMGLLGLVTQKVLSRTKEIGIRKVLGASAASIIAMISRDFLKLVFLALIVAIPIAWWVMNSWLEDFAYRIELEYWVFILVGITVIGIAFLTIGTQSLKAALANPVNSIKSE